jgi:hypothetical protein
MTNALLAISLFSLSLVGSAMAQDSAKALYVVDVAKVGGTAPPEQRKIAPALEVTKNSDAVLKGADERGRPVVALTDEGAASLKERNAISRVTPNAGVSWNPITSLKISYFGGAKPSLRELAQIGLQLLEDYPKGEFMLVRPKDNRIDAKIVRQLESNDKVRYVAPVAPFAAAESRQR